MPFLVGAAGSALFVLVLLIEGVARRGYSPVRHPVSALALGPRGWIQTASFLISGGAITWGGVALIGHQVVLGIVLMVFGAAVVASGAFPMDPMRGYPSGTPDGDPEGVSIRHLLHDRAGSVVFSALPIAALVAAFTMPGTGWAMLCVAAAVALTVAAGAFGMAWERDDPRTGLIQRAYIIPGWIWVAAVFLRLAEGLG